MSLPQVHIHLKTSVPTQPTSPIVLSLSLSRAGGTIHYIFQAMLVPQLVAPALVIFFPLYTETEEI